MFFEFIQLANPTETQCLIIKINNEIPHIVQCLHSHIILRTYNYGVAHIISLSSSELNLFTLTFDLPEIFHRRKRGDKVICFPEITALHNRKLTEALKTAIKLPNKEKDDFFIHTLLGQPAALVVFYCLIMALPIKEICKHFVAVAGSEGSLGYLCIGHPKLSEKIIISM